jgi:hypothetical protein
MLPSVREMRSNLPHTQTEALSPAASFFRLQRRAWGFAMADSLCLKGALPCCMFLWSTVYLSSQVMPGGWGEWDGRHIRYRRVVSIYLVGCGTDQVSVLPSFFRSLKTKYATGN